MDKIQECASVFRTLTRTTSYIFHTSLKGKISVIEIDFLESDFHHAVGLQYLADIDIPRNTKKIVDWILDNQITDAYLAHSCFYKGKRNDEKDVEKRIEEFRHIEEYLDSNNIVYIYSPHNAPKDNSLISCDYIIESKLPNKNTTVYIFIKRRRTSSNTYRIISFGVKKKVSYGGIYTYVMLKDKIVNAVRKTIFRHKKYTDGQVMENETGKLVAINVAENIHKSALDFSEKSKKEKYERRLKKYNSVFPEKYHSEEFNLPNMIVIVDDAVRRGIDVCEGAMGWLSNQKGMEVLHLYDEYINESGIQFVPAPVCDAAYYVDRFDRKRYIQTECIFTKAHEERMAELKNIAYMLGATYCSIEINESTSNMENKKQSVEVERLKQIGRGVMWQKDLS